MGEAFPIVVGQWYRLEERSPAERWITTIRDQIDEPPYVRKDGPKGLGMRYSIDDVILFLYKYGDWLSARLILDPQLSLELKGETRDKSRLPHAQMRTFPIHDLATDVVKGFPHLALEKLRRHFGLADDPAFFTPYRPVS